MMDSDRACLEADGGRAAIALGPSRYDAAPPFSPGVVYPEYPFGRGTCGAADNGVYDTVREGLRLLGLDAARFGTPEWNPLGEIVRPGDTVVLKPNLVRDFRETQPGHGNCLITHGSIIRSVVDYASIALGGKGRIVIADASHNDADFDVVRKIAALDEIREFYRQEAGFDVEVYDLRPECVRKIDGVIVGHSSLPGDPSGYVKVDLGARSAFMEVRHLCHLLYGAEYDMDELHRHHHGDVHEYLISKTLLQADCVISLPKLKTHKKAGITVNMKNLVGINGNKNWLPHHREGTPAKGGDQFPTDCVKHRIERSVVACFKRVFPLLGPLRRIVAGPVKLLGRKTFGDTNTDTVRSGNWYGNDTTWRMVVDLNRILFYAGADGVLHDRPVRRFFSVVDGIVAGEGNGPLDPTAKAAGVVVAGLNPVAVDLVCSRLMGFDYRRLPVLHRAMEKHPWALAGFEYDHIVCESNDARFARRLCEFQGSCLAFTPHFGWRGHVEVDLPDPLEEARSCVA